MPSPWFSGLLCFSFTKMAASENDAAQSTKNIGSASDEPKNRSQSADYEVEEATNYSEEQNDEQNSEDEEDSVGYSSPREAEEETAQTDRTKVTSKYGKGPHGAQKRKGPHGTLSRTKRKAKMPAKSGRNKKRRRSFSSTASSSESSSSSHSDSSDTDSSSTGEENNTWQMTKSEDLNAWKLPKKLAKTFAKNLNEHFTDEDINANILEENTVAKNIPQIPQLDSIMETYLGNNKMGYVAVNDKALSKITSKIRNITGPLSRVWKLCHKKKSTLRTKSIRKRMDQSMILISQAMQALTFHRRRTVLASLARDKDRAQRWLKEKYRKHLQTSKPELFGSNFMKAVQHDAKSVELNTMQYLQNQSKRPKQPFRGGSTAKQRPSRSRSHVERKRAAPMPNRGMQGKHSNKNEENTHLQHTTETSEPNKCTSPSKGDVTKLKEVTPNGRKAKTLSPTMGKIDKRPNNSGMDSRIQNPTSGKTTPKSNSKTTNIKRKTTPNCNKRGSKYVGDGRNSKSSPCQRGN